MGYRSLYLIVIISLLFKSQLVWAGGSESTQKSIIYKENPDDLVAIVNGVRSELNTLVSQYKDQEKFNFWSKDLFWAIASMLSSLGLVFFVEWLRKPTVILKIGDPVNLPSVTIMNNDIPAQTPARKLLKIRVTIVRNWRQYIPIPKNVHAVSKLKAKLHWTVKPEFQPKWDSTPEPIDYNNNQVKPEMVPFTMQSDNLVFGDILEAGLAMKHDGDANFWLFDADYYLQNPNNHCSLTRAKIKITFKSALVETSKTFTIANTGSSLSNFNLIN